MSATKTEKDLIKTVTDLKGTAIETEIVIGTGIGIEIGIETGTEKRTGHGTESTEKEAGAINLLVNAAGLNQVDVLARRKEGTGTKLLTFQLP